MSSIVSELRAIAQAAQERFKSEAEANQKEEQERIRTIDVSDQWSKWLEQIKNSAAMGGNRTLITVMNLDRGDYTEDPYRKTYMAKSIELLRSKGLTVTGSSHYYPRDCPHRHNITTHELEVSW